MGVPPAGHRGCPRAPRRTRVPPRRAGVAPVPTGVAPPVPHRGCGAPGFRGAPGLPRRTGLPPRRTGVAPGSDRGCSAGSAGLPRGVPGLHRGAPELPAAYRGAPRRTGVAPRRTGVAPGSDRGCAAGSAPGLRRQFRTLRGSATPDRRMHGARSCPTSGRRTTVGGHQHRFRISVRDSIPPGSFGDAACVLTPRMIASLERLGAKPAERLQDVVWSTSRTYEGTFGSWHVWSVRLGIGGDDHGSLIRSASPTGATTACSSDPKPTLGSIGSTTRVASRASSRRSTSFSPTVADATAACPRSPRDGAASGADRRR